MAVGTGLRVLPVPSSPNPHTQAAKPSHLSEAVRDPFRREIIPTEDGWGGWLGRYQTSLAKTAEDITRSREGAVQRLRTRSRDRSFGR